MYTMKNAVQRYVVSRTATKATTTATRSMMTMTPTPKRSTSTLQQQYQQQQYQQQQYQQQQYHQSFRTFASYCGAGSRPVPGPGSNPATPQPAVASLPLSAIPPATTLTSTRSSITVVPSPSITLGRTTPTIQQPTRSASTSTTSATSSATSTSATSATSSTSTTPPQPTKQYSSPSSYTKPPQQTSNNALPHAAFSSPEDQAKLQRIGTGLMGMNAVHGVLAVGLVGALIVLQGSDHKLKRYL